MTLEVRLKANNFRFYNDGENNVKSKPGMASTALAEKVQIGVRRDRASRRNRSLLRDWRNESTCERSLRQWICSRFWDRRQGRPRTLSSLLSSLLSIVDGLSQVGASPRYRDTVSAIGGRAVAEGYPNSLATLLRKASSLAKEESTRETNRVE